jgi:cytochrome c556
MTHMKLAAMATALVLAGSAVALAQSTNVSVSSDSLIIARQAGMSLVEGNIDAMKAAVKTKADVGGFKDAAGALSMWGKAIPGLFPPGTEKGDDTHALPTVWSDTAGFQKAAARLTAAADTLQAAAAKGDKDAFASAFQGLGQACGGCHRTYRAKM